MPIRHRQPQHTLEIVGIGEPCHYVFAATDGIQVDSSSQEPENDFVGTNTATGWVTTQGATDIYTINGDITDFEFVLGDADLFLDGTLITPSELTTECVTGVQTCSNDSACPDGQICVDGLCVTDPCTDMAGCGPNTPCPSGFTCQDGMCVEDTSGGNGGSNGGNGGSNGGGGGGLGISPEVLLLVAGVGALAVATTG